MTKAYTNAIGLEDVISAVSLAIGMCKTTQPRQQAEAALQAIADMGFPLFRPDKDKPRDC